MRPSTRQGGAVVAVTGLAVALLAAAPGTPVAAATCKPTPGILSTSPAASYSLPGGATVRIWDTNLRSFTEGDRRLAVVRIPKGSLTPAVVTSPTVARAARVSTMVKADPKAVVVLNGGTFNPTIPGIPDRVQISQGVVRKLVRQSYSNGLYGGIAVDSVNKTITGAAFDLAGSFSTRAGSAIIGSVNWQTLPSQGVAVYTYSWGNRSHPSGGRVVVVAGTKVTKILTGAAATRRPATWEKYLTARSGTAAASLLAKVKVGDAANVWYGANGTTRYAGYPATPFSRPSGATGSGGAIVRDGAVDAPCSSRDENPRPRSAIAWDAQGNMLIVAIAGKQFGSSWGGVSVHQFAGLLKQLGAVTAIRLDSGTSTTLWVRKTVGGPLLRLDRRGDDYEREVVDAVAFRVS